MQVMQHKEWAGVHSLRGISNVYNESGFLDKRVGVLVHLICC